MRANYSYNPKWFRHDRTRKPDLGERKPVTVCVATLFHWNYGTLEKPELGLAAIAASDRMITNFDAEYEPEQLKFAFVTSRSCILIAGAYPIHSEAILETMKQLKTTPEAHPQNIALIYGRAIQAIKRRHAEDIFLAPLSLNTDTFLAQQKDFSEIFVDRLTTQMQEYRGDDVEALIVGSDGTSVHLYQVDSRGIASCMNDVGFAAIGIGAWHARSRLMQAGYVNTAGYSTALAATYAAKKNAEIAPGVGKATDMRLIIKNVIEPIRADVFEKLEAVYADFETKKRALTLEALAELQKTIVGKPNAKGTRKPTTNPQADERPDTPAAEASREDETKKQTTWEAYRPEQKT